MNQITPQQPPRQRMAKVRGTPLEKRYYAWLHRECVCCLTQYPVFQIAHTGPKFAMSRKGPLRSCLPLRFELHIIEEAGRKAFWERVGIPDHLDWADRLYEIFKSDQDPRDLLMDMHDKANLFEVAAMLRGTK